MINPVQQPSTQTSQAWEQLNPQKAGNITPTKEFTVMSCNWNRRQWLLGLAQVMLALLWSWKAGTTPPSRPRRVSPQSRPMTRNCFTTTIYNAEGRVVSVTDLQARDTNRSFDR